MSSSLQSVSHFVLSSYSSPLLSVTQPYLVVYAVFHILGWFMSPFFSVCDGVSLLVCFRGQLCYCYLPLFLILLGTPRTPFSPSLQICQRSSISSWILRSSSARSTCAVISVTVFFPGLFPSLRMSYVVCSLGYCHSVVLILEFLPLRQSPGRFHYGLRTRRGVPPPCTRDPTFHPCILPLRPGLRSLVCLYEVGAEPAA